ncbi:hypothetical protein I7I50_09001 [Histoplasma capsulatum G186AR]|uniref:Uncharacterized protein n=1 Tax=Ajellomyces capsulatus TaxID=5037 RepID=A0A8H7YRV3_AJECA|nr:hypothetical protein I7I52_06516 [Histoplasma capsulatum]QSS74019.1 hypothetical protein I7I50_09001 [Histoplasma capsulatum G186AR]
MLALRLRQIPLINPCSLPGSAPGDWGYLPSGHSHAAQILPDLAPFVSKPDQASVSGCTSKSSAVVQNMPRFQNIAAYPYEVM